MGVADQIRIRGLELRVHLGVPDAERAVEQVVEADVTLGLRRGFDAMPDDIAATVDYAVLVEEVRKMAAARPRRLLETLAAEIVALLSGDARVAEVEVELRKRILPGVDHVAVRLRRPAG